MEEIREQQLLIRGRAFATFSTIEKVLTPGAEATHHRCASTRFHTQLQFDHQLQPLRRQLPRSRGVLDEAT